MILELTSKEWTMLRHLQSSWVCSKGLRTTSDSRVRAPSSRQVALRSTIVLSMVKYQQQPNNCDIRSSVNPHWRQQAMSRAKTFSCSGLTTASKQTWSFPTKSDRSSKRVTTPKEGGRRKPVSRTSSHRQSFLQRCSFPNRKSSTSSAITPSIICQYLKPLTQWG